MSKVEAFKEVCPKCDWSTIEETERVARWVMELHQSVVHREAL